MKNWKLRMASAALAVCMAAVCAAPVFAMEGQTTESAQKNGTVVNSLLDVPVIGDLLRLFIPDNTTTPESAATGETAATAETAQTMFTAETADDAGETQTATAESATALAGEPEPTATTMPEPTTTVEPQATATTEPQESIAPEATKTPAPEEIATSTPAAEAAAEPTAEPEASAKPEPDAASVAGDTADAAATPTPTAEPTATPEPTSTPKPTVTWPAAWMIGAVQTGKTYPMGNSTATALTATQTLWGNVELYSGAILRATSREETNLGSLVADAMSAAAASDSRYVTDPALNKLPVVAMLDGARLSGTIEEGKAIDATELANVLKDDTLAMVTVTPAKLKEIINAALVGMLDTNSSNFGNFMQVSGLRFTYATTDGEQRVDSVWLADATAAEGKALDLNDTTSKIVLVLPASLQDAYGVNAAAGYTDWLNGAKITLRGAVLDLPTNVDAKTLESMLARGGSAGRILPVTAANFSAMLLGGYSSASTRVKGLVDGKEVEFIIDEKGSLIIDNLTPGSHTLRMKAGEPAYYISSVTHIGTSDGSVVQVASIPADCVIGPIPTPTAAPTEAPTTAPTAAPTAAPETQNRTESDTSPRDESGDSAADNSAGTTVTAAPAPVAPAAPAAPAKTSAPASGTQSSSAGATAAPVKDPTKGTILNNTPAPTIEPTPTPAATPSPAPNVTPNPTADPAVIEQIQQAEKKSSQLPLYAGLGLLGVCAVVGGGLYAKRKYDDAQDEKSRAEHYRKQ